jgi:hypothetical protein
MYPGNDGRRQNPEEPTQFGGFQSLVMVMVMVEARQGHRRVTLDSTSFNVADAAHPQVSYALPTSSTDTQRSHW